MNKHLGSNFDDFLAEEGILTEAVALKRVIAFQLEQKMQRSDLSKTELATRAVTLRTLERAAGVLGKRLKLELI
jgi:antitoxin HicB